MDGWEGSYWKSTHPPEPFENVSHSPGGFRERAMSA